MSLPNKYASFMNDVPQTTALQQVPGLRWIDRFMTWSPGVRLRGMTLVIGLYVLVFWTIGAEIRHVLSSVGMATALGGALAVFVTLARGVQADLTRSGRADLLDELVPNVRRYEIAGAHCGGFAACASLDFAFNGELVGWLAVIVPPPAQAQPGTAAPR
jgi:hypothetical protein